MNPENATPAAEDVITEEEPHPEFPPSSSKSLLSFRIFKKLRLPNVVLLVQPTDVPPNTTTTSSSSPPPAPHGVPSYHTTPLSFLHLPAVPPSFTLLLGGATSNDKPRAKLSFHPHFSGVEIKISFLSDTDATTSLGYSTSPPPLPTAVCHSSWTRRIYEFQLPGNCRCIWKGTKTHANDLSPTRENEDGSTSGRGNLKLVAEDGSLVAVFRNMTDMDTLGLLTVDTAGCVGLLAETKVEETVAMCVAVVVLERIQYKGWVGGLGKKAKEGER